MVSKRQHQIKIPKGGKIYFASDQHFGSPNTKESIIREKKFTQWLDEIKPDACALFLLGDLFDFWFEYKQVVPKGFVRVLGKLAELADAGIPIYFFIGNHDLWMRDYLKQELNANIFKEPQRFLMNDKRFLIAHGDGLGPGDYGYKFLKRIFTNPVAKTLFYLLHPDFSIWLGKMLSERNKYLSGNEEDSYQGDGKEWLFQYAQAMQEKEKFDYLVFGHRHLALEKKVGEKSTYFNIGDWIKHFTYGEFDGFDFSLKTYCV